MEALALDNPAGIKQYFEKVCELNDIGHEFPIEWDLVWPLVYTRKDTAVDYLKQYFIEDVDYEVFHQKPGNSKGGRPAVEYKISTACLEFSVARKIPAVFECYRRVFHKTRKAISAPSRKELALLVIEQEEAVEAATREARLLRHENDSLQVTVEIQNKELSVSAPKAKSYDEMIASDGLLTAGQLAQVLGFRKAEDLNKYLHKKKVIKKNNDSWILTAEYTGNGYTGPKKYNYTGSDGSPKVKVNTCWTQRGEEFLRAFVKLNPEGQKKIIKPNLEHQLLIGS